LAHNSSQAPNSIQNNPFKELYIPPAQPRKAGWIATALRTVESGKGKHVGGGWHMPDKLRDYFFSVSKLEGKVFGDDKYGEGFITKNQMEIRMLLRENYGARSKYEIRKLNRIVNGSFRDGSLSEGLQ